MTLLAQKPGLIPRITHADGITVRKHIAVIIGSVHTVLCRFGNSLKRYNKRCHAKVGKKAKNSFHTKGAAKATDGTWKTAFANATDVMDNGTVGDDGALYVATSKGDALVRCVDGTEPAAACEPMALRSPG